VALVDVVLADPDIQRGEHPGPADPEHNRLLQAVLLVAAVEVVGYPPVFWCVLREVRIKEEDRHEAADGAPVIVEPGPDRDVGVSYPDGHPPGKFPHVLPWVPLVRKIDLVAFRGQSLPHVAFPVDERHRDHGDEKIGARTDDVPGKHAETAAVGRDLALDADLHGEVGDLLAPDERIPAEFA